MKYMLNTCTEPFHAKLFDNWDFDFKGIIEESPLLVDQTHVINHDLLQDAEQGNTSESRLQIDVCEDTDQMLHSMSLTFLDLTEGGDLARNLSKLLVQDDSEYQL